MGNIVFEYRQIEQKIGDLKEIAIIIKEMNKNDILLPKISKKIRYLIFEQAKVLK